MTRRQEAAEDRGSGTAEDKSDEKPERGTVPGTEGAGGAGVARRFKPGGGNTEGGATNTGPNAGRGGMGSNQ